MVNDMRRLTTEELRHELLLWVVKDTYERAAQLAPVVREAALDDDSSRLVDMLVKVRSGAIDLLFAIIDGVALPEGWPQVRLVNSETNEDISSSLAEALSEAEGEYLEEQSSV